MKQLIRGALFSASAAQEQRLHETAQNQITGISRIGPTDIRDIATLSARIAKGFRRHDPTKSKLATLLKGAK